MGEVEDAVRNLLRSSEQVKVVLEISSSTTLAVADHGVQSESHSSQDPQRRRVLAVISHKDERKESEEGSVFICKYKASTHGVSNELDIQFMFPIVGDFSISMTQMRRGTIDLSVPASKYIASETPGGTGFSLTINPGQGPEPDIEPQSLTFFTKDVQGLRDILSECKRLKMSLDGAEQIKISQSSTQFRWLLPYSSQHSLPQTWDFPLDLRLLNKPLYTRLSPASAGLPGDDAADIILIRNEWIRSNARNLSRKSRRQLSIRLGTFNVNGKLPSQDLFTWLGDPTRTAGLQKTIPPLKDISPLSLGGIIQNSFDFTSKPSDSTSNKSVNIHDKTSDSFGTEPVDSNPNPDIIVLGFQELDLSTEALIYSTSSVREDAWSAAVFAALGENGVLYEKLASKQLVGMLIMILVKKTLRPCFQDIRTSFLGAGIMGVMGNKGGTAIRLTFIPHVTKDDDATTPGPTTFTFVNSHLAAFDEMYEKRNSDFQDISKRMNFNSDVMDSTGSSLLPLSVYESDVLFWMGDLNYRIDLPDADIRNILRSDEWSGRFELLLKYDQLRKAIRNKKAFDGFSELSITHPPTYRFSPGVTTDDLGYDIKRKPAWTDRILYMSAPYVMVQQLSYMSHPQITMSDHKPVTADFIIDVDLYDRNTYDATARRLFREVSYWDEGALERTSIKLDSTSINLGRISYKRRTSKNLQLQNNGKVPCAYRFVPINFTSDIHPDWLQIHPMNGLILPDETICITITAYVDNGSASQLNMSPKELSVTLILHTLFRKDHFISVSGVYDYTCFANKLSTLTRLPGPIQSITSPDDLRPENHPINAPREIMRLVNWMMSDHVNIDGLFIEPADEHTVDTIRECLDSGADFPVSSNSADPKISLAFAVTLLQLLDSLVDPIVPSSLHLRCTQVTSRDEAFELLDAFPPGSVNVWITVTAFLHFICQSSPNEPDKAEKIANVFTPIFLRDDPNPSLHVVSPIGKRNFLMYFIT